MARVGSRRIGILVALALVLSFLTVAPPPAEAHEACARPEAPSGLAGSAITILNVFSSFLPVDDQLCSDKFADVDVKIERDFELAPTSGVGERGRGDGAAAAAGPCEGGLSAGTFACSNIDMLSHVSHEELGTTFVNDVWGWTDPESLKDYVLVGSSTGTAFVDISNPTAPQVLGKLPTASTVGGSSWRDIKVYADHAYVVSEHSNHGVQVFDLTQLRDWDGTYTTYEETARYTGHGSAHNININTDTGFLYSVGANQAPSGIDCSTGLHMIDINEPTEPTFAGCFDGHGYVHDTQCVIYDGPDTDYVGRELCFNSNATTSAPGGQHAVAVVDVTDKANPQTLSREFYPQEGYSHQGWLTEDHRYFLHGDELDEVRQGINTTTRVWDMTDLDNPELIQAFANDTTSIDHNIYTKGRFAYASNYTSGLRLYDLRDIADGDISEAGFFDLYPENDDPTFEGGTWSNYPWFHQKGVVAAGSMDRGLFILGTRLDRANS